MIKRVFLFLIVSLITFPALAKEGEARIVTSVNRPVDCLFSVVVYNINGKEVNKPPLAFNLEPGKYTLKAQASFDRKQCSPTAKIAKIIRIDPLELEVEAGKSYFLAYNASSPDYKDWKMEVYKVE